MGLRTATGSIGRLAAGTGPLDCDPPAPVGTARPGAGHKFRAGGLRQTSAGRLRALFAVSVVLLSGIALRVWILSGPLGEVEADESVVGLMALHIQAGEHPAFYWGQSVLGSLEAYLVAAAFFLFGPSNLVLKSTAGSVYLAFVLL